MQSTAARPGLGHALYRRFREDVLVAEELGFDSIWVGEHRLWYCGWCPAPLHALAAAAATTTRIRLGTAMYLVPQHEPVSAARAIGRLDELSGGRVELGAGLGYRDAEFDALGLRRDRRGNPARDRLLDPDPGGRAERGDSGRRRRRPSPAPALHCRRCQTGISRAA